MVRTTQIDWTTFTEQISISDQEHDDGSASPSCLDLNIPPPALDPAQKLEVLLKRCFLVILTDCLDALSVLACVYTVFAEKYQALPLKYMSLEERFDNAGTNFGECRINVSCDNMHKLQKDVSLVMHILRTLIEELNEYDCCIHATIYMQNLIKMQHDEKNLMNELDEKLKKFENLKRLQMKKRDTITSFNKYAGYNQSLKEATRRYYDEAEKIKVGIRFVEQWQNARVEQNQIKIRMKQNNLHFTTESTNWNILVENRCHEEISDYIMETQADYLSEMQNWIDQYESTLESRETDIYNLKLDIEEMADRREALQNKYDARVAEMEKWLKYKERKKQEEELLNLQVWAATKIEAWWRGVMVRKNLGPFKKNFKAKKSKNSKKKK